MEGKGVIQGMAKPKIELDGQAVLRCFDAEMRASDDGGMKVEGYALKFDKETQIGGKKWGWKESIAKTALDGADLGDVVFDLNHSFDLLLARTKNGSLSLKADGIGLKTSANIVDTATGRDVYRMVKDGLVTKMSFWAVIKGSEWIFADDDSDEMDRRVITEFGRFYDVSAVTFPAYEDTEIAARCMEVEMLARRRQVLERHLSKVSYIVNGYRKFKL